MQVKEVMALRGWWFGGDALPHGDGRPVAVGAVHEVLPPIVPCEHGLHCSRRALDALQYADCSTVWRVEVWGEVAAGADKIAASHRRYMWRLDATAVLRRFACREALRVLPDGAPEVVREYLVLADRATDSQRAAAWAASAAASAASAASDAALAARAAAQMRQRASAAWAAARAAASAAASAAWAASDAAWDAAWAAAQMRQRASLEAMLFAAHAKQSKEE